MDPAGLLESYAAEIRRLREDPEHDPETSLHGPLEKLLSAMGTEYRRDLRVLPQRRSQCGVPDFALSDAGAPPFAWVEAKEPGKRIDEPVGEDRRQRERYDELGCVLYTNFHQMLLVIEGRPTDEGVVALVDERALDPEKRRAPPAPTDAKALALLERLFRFPPEPMRSAAVVTRRVRPLMSYGKDERDIDKSVWMLPIPAFDAACAAHRRLAQLGGRAEEALAQLEIDPNLHFAASRRRMREWLESSDTGREIEPTVESLLG